jgi:hypothetical protein
MSPTLRFSDLNPLGRAIIMTVAVLTLGVAAAAFATSYGALYALVRDTGLYSGRLARAYPLLLDAAFIAAELAAILGGILRGGRGWPVTVMLITGTLTIAFNVMHAMDDWADWTRGLIAALPPVMMILSFQVDLAIVGWVMRALGRSDSDGSPGAFLGVPAVQTSSAQRLPSGQSGHEWGSGGVAGGAAVTKREAVQAYLTRLGPNAALITAREVKEDLAEEGVNVSEQYVGRVMSGALGGRNGRGHV